MATTFERERRIKQGDTAPPLEATLRDAVTKAPVDLTGATQVRFKMRPAGSGATPTVDANAAIIGDPVNGRVRYVWVDADTAVPGRYEAEYQITWADTTKQTVPNEGYFFVNVIGDLDD